ncbi:MAG: SEL1-like repeat protein [Candidatus Thiodiazotropha sp. (ex Monitilora ramsayi)]|nr:SEL1-like repeat protein [Candidatus Thiodiazotropha sp. (ex Monitilora ramsayi)]
MLFIALQIEAQTDPFEMGMASLKEGDFAEAYCLWRPLAMRGHTEASFHLGWLYANGNGLRVDIPKAIYWWGQAANRGHSDAMFALALAYTQGEGIKQNDDEAVRWYFKAARNGHEDAREILKDKIRAKSKQIQPYLADILKENWLGFEVKISAAEANLRSGPGIDQPLAGKTQQGESFVAIQHVGKWLQVIRPDDLHYAWIADWLTDLRH